MLERISALCGLAIHAAWKSAGIRTPGVGLLAQCNLLLSAALHFCGAPVRKTLRIFNAIGLQVPSEDTYLAHLSGILQPTTWMVWQQQQAELFSRLRQFGGDLCLTVT